MSGVEYMESRLMFRAKVLCFSMTPIYVMGILPEILAVHQPNNIFNSISTLPTQHITFI